MDAGLMLRQQDVIVELAGLCRDILHELGQYRAVEDEEARLNALEKRREERQWTSLL